MSDLVGFLRVPAESGRSFAVAQDDMAYGDYREEKKWRFA